MSDPAKLSEDRNGWQDSPKNPGLWICKHVREMPYLLLILGASDPLIQANPDARWYGPIPVDAQVGSVSATEKTAEKSSD